MIGPSSPDHHFQDLAKTSKSDVNSEDHAFHALSDVKPVSCISLLLTKFPRSTSRLQDAISYIGDALKEGSRPELLNDCTNGTYMLYNEWCEPEAIFKPMDEESFSENNPKGHSPSCEFISPPRVTSPMDSLTNSGMFISPSFSSRFCELNTHPCSSNTTSNNNNINILHGLSFGSAVNSSSSYSSYSSFSSNSFSCYSSSCSSMSSGIMSSSSSCSRYRGISPGSSAYREVAAFLLDRNGFAGVPETSLVSVHSPGFWVDGQCSGTSVTKVGSLQLYVRHNGSSEDYGSSLFEAKNIQGIALLDMRLMNLDRHGNNLLASMKSALSGIHAQDDNKLKEHRASLLSSFVSRRSQSLYCDPYTASQRVLHLTPIDHGLCMPELCTSVRPEWCWRMWPQALEQIDSSLLEWVQSWNCEKDELMIKQFWDSVPLEACFTFRLNTLFIQLACCSKLSIADMSKLYTEPLSSCMSMIDLLRDCKEEDGVGGTYEIGLTMFQNIALRFYQSVPPPPPPPPQPLSGESLSFSICDFSESFDDFLKNVAKPMLIRFMNGICCCDVDDDEEEVEEEVEVDDVVDV